MVSVGEWSERERPKSKAESQRGTGTVTSDSIRGVLSATCDVPAGNAEREHFSKAVVDKSASNAAESGGKRYANVRAAKR